MILLAGPLPLAAVLYFHTELQRPVTVLTKCAEQGYTGIVLFAGSQHYFVIYLLN